MTGSADFVPSHALVTAPGAPPERWMLVLHGIFGSGANWRTFARRLAEAQAPGGRRWGFILVDLRAHGQSQGAPAPHGVGAAADDLLRLGARLGLDIRGVMGHSFGGKVALAYLGRRSGEIERGFLLDADPGARAAGASGTTTTASVLDLLKAMPQPFASREAFVEAVLAGGHGRGIAEWLAMNVRRAPGDDVLRLRLDLDVMSALLADYFAQDLWHVLEDPWPSSAGGARRDVGYHMILGGRSDTVGPAARERLEALAARAPWLSVHVLERAGHWLHVDDPDGLFALVRAAL